jgi:transposase
MLDELIVTETPPLSYCYGRLGEQRCVPIIGARSKRIVHGALNIATGDMALLITHDWTQFSHQAFLDMIRAKWRGWSIVLFQDRGAPHTAVSSRRHLHQLDIEVRWLPRATPELNAVDHLWRHAKAATLANAPIRPIAESAMAFCEYIINLSPHERLLQAGALAPEFWLAR